MKISILDGGLSDQTTDAIRILLLEIGRQQGDHVQPFVRREQKIAYCLGCFECWTKTPGRCRIADDGQAIAQAIIHSDLVIYLTPITFGGYSSALKMAVDRTICLISPFFTKINGEVHHRKRYAHYPSLLGIGLLPPRALQKRWGRTRMWLTRSTLWESITNNRCGGALPWGWPYSCSWG